MWRARVPEQQVTRFGTDFNPLQAAVGEPFHAILGEAVPLWRPSWYTLFLGHSFVELLTHLVAAFAYDKTTVVGAVGKQIYQSGTVSRGSSVPLHLETHPCRHLKPGFAGS